MELTNNLNITKLFASKQITITVDNQFSFTVVPKLVRDFVEDESWNQTFYLLTLNVLDWKEMFGGKIDYDESLYYIQTVIFQLAAYKQYREVANNFEKYIKELIPSLEIQNTTKEFIINGVTITPEIWNYVIYVLQLTCGKKVQKPHTFSTPAERSFYLKQQEMERRIKKIRQNNATKGEDDGILKSMLAITYSFPSISFDYLFDQTLAQIHWLAKMAAQEVSYRVNAQAFAAGNMKKGKKLEFFIK